MGILVHVWFAYVLISAYRYLRRTRNDDTHKDKVDAADVTVEENLPFIDEKEKEDETKHVRFSVK
jgi:hypothetical protein